MNLSQDAIAMMLSRQWKFIGKQRMPQFSEKLGVAILGRRFSDKVEHAPIKKRSFIFQS